MSELINYISDDTRIAMTFNAVPFEYTSSSKVYNNYLSSIMDCDDFYFALFKLEKNDLIQINPDLKIKRTKKAFDLANSLPRF